MSVSSDYLAPVKQVFSRFTYYLEVKVYTVIFNSWLNKMQVYAAQYTSKGLVKVKTAQILKLSLT